MEPSNLNFVKIYIIILKTYALFKFPGYRSKIRELPDIEVII